MSCEKTKPTDIEGDPYRCYNEDIHGVGLLVVHVPLAGDQEESVASRHSVEAEAYRPSEAAYHTAHRNHEMAAVRVAYNPSEGDLSQVHTVQAGHSGMEEEEEEEEGGPGCDSRHSHGAEGESPLEGSHESHAEGS
jgi:hypothetical protein